MFDTPMDPLLIANDAVLTIDPKLRITAEDYEIAARDARVIPDMQDSVHTAQRSLARSAFHRTWHMEAWTARREDAEKLVQEHGPDDSLIYEAAEDCGFYVYYRRVEEADGD